LYKKAINLFSLYHPYIFDVDNVKIEYAIAATKYHHFFLNNNYNNFVI